MDRMGLADGSPTSPSLLAEVKSGYVVRIVLEAAVHAPEECLSPAVVLVDYAAPGAALRCEVGARVHDGNSGIGALVAEHAQQLRDCPASEGRRMVLALAGLYYVAGPGLRQSLQGDVLAVLQGVHKPPAYLVERGPGPAQLFPGQPFEPPLG